MIEDTPRDNAAAEAVRIARGMLDGSIDPVVGCRRIQGPLRHLGLREAPEYLIFIGVDSEADHLAIGDERQHWQPEALRRSDAELAGAIEHYGPSIRVACHRVVENLGNPSA